MSRCTERFKATGLRLSQLFGGDASQVHRLKIEPTDPVWAGRVSVSTLLPLAALGLLVLASSRVGADESPKPRDVAVTLQADGEHCVVRKVKFLCTDLASHLRDTLKLPADTMIRLRAGRSASFEAIRRTLTIIENSGYRYPGARLKEPPALQEHSTP